MAEYFRTTPEQRVPYIRELIQRYKESGDILGKEVLKYKEAYEVFQANKGSTAEERDEAFLKALGKLASMGTCRTQLTKLKEKKPAEYRLLWGQLGDFNVNFAERIHQFLDNGHRLIQETLSSENKSARGKNTFINETNLITFYIFCISEGREPVLEELKFYYWLAPVLSYPLEYDHKKAVNHEILLQDHYRLAQEIKSLLKNENELNEIASSKLHLSLEDPILLSLIHADIQLFERRLLPPILFPRDVYNPGISKEAWIQLWKNEMSVEEKSLLKRLMDIGNDQWINEMSVKYGLSEDKYKKILKNLNSKIENYIGYPQFYFLYEISPYLITHTDGDPKLRRLRPELKDALEELKVMEDDSIPLYEPGKEKKAEEEKGDPDTMTERNIILYGPPGTGKTYHTINYALHLIEDKELKKLEEEDREALQERFQNLREKGQVSFTTFHQSYGYEEFIEGIKPVMMEEVESKGNEDDGKDVGYRIEQGLFQRFCREAEKNPEENYVFIIDEINRGNISKIFGELITLIENSKRLGGPEEARATLPYSGKEFGVPQNVFLLGTMNTADRSIALLDTALRRRFRFVEMMPDPSILDGIAVDGVNIRGLLKVLNERIELLYDREHTIGHAYFTPLREDPSLDALEGIFKDRIFPLLQEYFYEDYGKIRAVLGDGGKEEEHQFIKRVEKNWSDLFPDVEGESYEGRDSFSYEVNHKAFSLIESYRGIYRK